jgi:hypothetical protein
VRANKNKPSAITEGSKWVLLESTLSFYRCGRIHRSKSRCGNKHMPREGLKRLNGPPRRPSPSTAKPLIEVAPITKSIFAPSAPRPLRARVMLFAKKIAKQCLNAEGCKPSHQNACNPSTTTPMCEGDAFRNFKK